MKTFSVIVGNPPYGSGGNLAIQFLNRCCSLSNDIRLVMPVSIQKPSSINKVEKALELIHDETLPDETFPRGIKTAYQIWHRTHDHRDKIKTLTTHSDFDFVKKQDDPDCMIFRCGASTGKLRLPGEFDDNKPDHYYIRCEPEILTRLKGLTDELISIGKQQNGMLGISKHDLITTYISHYG